MPLRPAGHQMTLCFLQVEVQSDLSKVKKVCQLTTGSKRDHPIWLHIIRKQILVWLWPNNSVVADSATSTQPPLALFDLFIVSAPSWHTHNPAVVVI